MSKTLSNGVLNLRFMQNAQRVKQLKEVELQRAEVVDESRWEISQTVREAWDLKRERNEDLDADVHEPSYLPFLYFIAEEGSSKDRSAITVGRKVFKSTTFHSPDGDGKVTQGKDVPATSMSNSSSKPSKARIHAHPRPISISKLPKGKATLLKGFDQLSEGDHDDADLKSRSTEQEIWISKSSARDLIFESGNVGVDLRDQASKMVTPRAFMKPAGINDPKERAEAASSSSAAQLSSEVGAQIIYGTRQRLKRVKRERDQDEMGDEEEEVKKKQKKKKKNTVSR